MNAAWLGLLPYLAFAAALLAVVAGVLHLRGQAAARTWMRRLLAIAAGAAIATMLVLIALFVLVRVDVQYVFQYTSQTVPLRYRIAGAYAGREGSMALWAMYAVIVAAAVAWWHRREGRAGQTGTGAVAGAAQRLHHAPAADPLQGAAGDDEADGPNTSRISPDAASRAWTELLLAAIAAAFLGAVALQDTFGATSEFLLRNRPGGNGLNPTLLSPFILIHPPVMFLAYALTAVPLAAVIADQITGAQAWSRIGMVWSRVDWLVYTFAMGLGGIWAYYTLGFGGYWAWDPVEVANLLPWLALTLFLHAQLHHRRHGRYQHIGPLLGVLPFVLTIFSTISTRSGLWVSVHAFTDPTGTFDPDAASRMLAILTREPGLQFHAAIMLGALLAFLAMWGRRIATDTGRLPVTSRIVAGILGAAAVAAILAPAMLLGAVLELGSRATGGRVGYGLLAVTALAFLLPAAPLLLGDEPARRPRLDLRTFNLAAVTLLGVGLMVMFLWHVAAANGWSTRAYMGRFPLLAAPVLVGLLAFQAHALWRRNALWIAAGVAVAAGLAYLIDARWALLTLGVPLVAVSVLRVLRAAREPGLPRWLLAARSGLWVAALLNVLFWVNPPTVRLLAIEWRPMWPAQLVFGIAAFMVLHRATMLLTGRTQNARSTHILVGALGGFYVTPVVAAASWWVHRRGQDVKRRAARGGAAGPEPAARTGHPSASGDEMGTTAQQGIDLDAGHATSAHGADPALRDGVVAAAPRRPTASRARSIAARTHQAGLYGIHLAVALAIVGYTLTAYVGQSSEHVLTAGVPVESGGAALELLRVDQDTRGGLVERLLPVVQVTSGASTQATGVLHWEPQSSSYYPLPATARLWHGDVYFAVDAVCIDVTGACDRASDWVRAYDVGGRLPAGVAVTQVEVQAFTLPGIALVWGALFLWLYFMALVMRHGPERP